MELIRKIKWNDLKHEYGEDGERLLPWGDSKFPFPFGGAYCITRAGTTSKDHINAPADEEEMFVAIAGKAKVFLDDGFHDIEQGDVVYIPAGKLHYVDNPFDEDFHFYALWWNNDIVSGYRQEKQNSLVNG
mgnify:FL=1